MDILQQVLSDIQLMEIYFLSAGCGDGIHIRFLGNDDKYHNVLIDGGVEKGKIYPTSLKQVIHGIVSRKELIDLWIITHIDDDHIGGVLRFLKDKPLLGKVDLSRTVVWYNYSTWDYDTGIKDSNLKSVNQGMRLRDYLRANAVVHESITEGGKIAPFFGAEFLILSPAEEQFQKLAAKWKLEEVKIRQKMYTKEKQAKKNDYHQRLSAFDLTKFKEDNSEENGSSIAFLFKYKEVTGLFLADSYPSQIVDALHRLGYSRKAPLTVDFVKLSHHGSKFNTSDDLIALIHCDHFILCADGIGHNLPDKETLARIMHKRAEKEVSFYFTHKNDFTTRIFDVDGDLPYIKFHFPDKGSTKIAMTFKIQ